MRTWSCPRRPCRRRTKSACAGKWGRESFSAARHAADRRPVHPHAAMPRVELFQEKRVDVEEINGSGVRQADQFHEALQHEQVVQVDELLAQLPLVLRDEVSVEEIAEVVLQVLPTHGVMRPWRHPRYRAGG